MKQAEGTQHEMISPAELETTFDSRDQEELIQFNGMNFSIQKESLKFIKFSEQVTTKLEF